MLTAAQKAATFKKRRAGYSRARYKRDHERILKRRLELDTINREKLRLQHVEWRKNNQERTAKFTRKSRAHGKAILTDGYVKKIIYGRIRVSARAITPIMIEATRLQLKLRRVLKEKP